MRLPGTLSRSLLLVTLALQLICGARDLRAQSELATRTQKPLAQALPHTPRIALVLSGGGAKGFAHVGVLHVFDSAHIPIDLIVGTSIGAAIGGLYSSGYSPEALDHFATSTDWSDVLELDDESHRSERVLNRKDPESAILSLRFNGFLKPVIPTAISSGQRLTMLMNQMVINSPRGVPFDFLRDLRTPFIAVATDIVSGTRRLLTEGDLTGALRASATLPLRFTPLTRDSAILVDGGLLANIPVDIAKDSTHAMLTIVSNTTAGLRKREDLSTPWDVADQVITLMMMRENERSLKQADVVISPELPEGSDDFRQIDRLIEAGKRAARAMLPQIQWMIKERGIDITNRTQTSEQPIWVNSARIHPAPTIDTSLIPTRALLRELTRTALLDSIDRVVLDAYRSEGYTLARVDSVLYSRTNGRLDIYLDEGRIGEVRVSGNQNVHPDVIRREFPLSKGDVFRASEAERGISNLTGTGYFDFASLEVRRDSSWSGSIFREVSDSFIPQDPTPANTTGVGGPIVTLTVRVKAANVLRLGVKADNEFGAQFSTELANENLLGSGTEISLKGGIGPAARYAALTFDAPRLFRTNGTFSLQGYSEYRDISTYSTLPIVPEGRIVTEVTDEVREARDAGVRLQLGGQVGKLGAVTAELRTERQRAFSLKDQTLLDPSRVLTSFRGELVIDSRDDRDYPSEGSYGGIYWETGLPLLGGELSYTKLYAKIEQPVPLSDLHTLTPRIEAGFGDLTLPRLEQFALGGIESFYGLNAYELRGRQMVVGSITYQIEIPHSLFFPTFVAFRYDVGNTWLEPSTIKFLALVHGIGAQIGLKTPFGLARFGIGENFRFNEARKKPIDINSPRFYFSIGANL